MKPIFDLTVARAILFSFFLSTLLTSTSCVAQEESKVANVERYVTRLLQSNDSQRTEIRTELAKDPTLDQKVATEFFRRAVDPKTRKASLEVLSILKPNLYDRVKPILTLTKENWPSEIDAILNLKEDITPTYPVALFVLNEVLNSYESSIKVESKEIGYYGFYLEDRVYFQILSWNLRSGTPDAKLIPELKRWLWCGRGKNGEPLLSPRKSVTLFFPEPACWACGVLAQRKPALRPEIASILVPLANMDSPIRSPSAIEALAECGLAARDHVNSLKDLRFSSNQEIQVASEATLKVLEPWLNAYQLTNDGKDFENLLKLLSEPKVSSERRYLHRILIDHYPELSSASPMMFLLSGERDHYVKLLQTVQQQKFESNSELWEKLLSAQLSFTKNWEMHAPLTDDGFQPVKALTQEGVMPSGDRERLIIGLNKAIDDLKSKFSPKEKELVEELVNYVDDALNKSAKKMFDEMEAISSRAHEVRFEIEFKELESVREVVFKRASGEIRKEVLRRILVEESVYFAYLVNRQDKSLGGIKVRHWLYILRKWAENDPQSHSMISEAVYPMLTFWQKFVSSTTPRAEELARSIEAVIWACKDEGITVVERFLANPNDVIAKIKMHRLSGVGDKVSNEQISLKGVQHELEYLLKDLQKERKKRTDTPGSTHSSSDNSSVKPFDKEKYLKAMSDMMFVIVMDLERLKHDRNMRDHNVKQLKDTFEGDDDEWKKAAILSLDKTGLSLSEVTNKTDRGKIALTIAGFVTSCKVNRDSLDELPVSLASASVRVLNRSAESLSVNEKRSIADELNKTRDLILSQGHDELRSTKSPADHFELLTEIETALKRLEQK